MGGYFINYNLSINTQSCNSMNSSGSQVVFQASGVSPSISTKSNYSATAYR